MRLKLYISLVVIGPSAHLVMSSQASLVIPFEWGCPSCPDSGARRLNDVSACQASFLFLVLAVPMLFHADDGQQGVPASLASLQQSIGSTWAVYKVQISLQLLDLFPHIENDNRNNHNDLFGTGQDRRQGRQRQQPRRF